MWKLDFLESVCVFHYLDVSSRKCQLLRLNFGGVAADLCKQLKANPLKLMKAVIKVHHMKH